ncbi:MULTISPECIES: TetR/AcrR family transcriptional regulator [unclassified Nocardiopsis]|uniref:TetR/AcrR family transcriptional regulator n=1 Tax=Nocardiopsis TaxID=2013 RepID=UPI00387AF139
MTAESSGRPMRADARRNRARLLAEADTVLREQGTGAPLEQIARRAGVAVGTLYAHFPTRRALLLELLRERHEALFALGDGLTADADAPPGEALLRWARAVADHGAVYSGLSDELLGGLEDPESELHEACARLSAAGTTLTERARTAGQIRAGVTADDVFALISAAAWTRDRLSDPARADHMTDLVLSALRP